MQIESLTFVNVIYTQCCVIKTAILKVLLIKAIIQTLFCFISSNVGLIQKYIVNIKLYEVDYVK